MIMNRNFHYLIGVALCCCVSVSSAQSVCPAFDGRIFLDSVEYNQSGQPIAGIFGYELNASTPVRMSAGGPCNFFLPTNFRKGMLTTFEPGLHERAFRVEVAANETLFFWFFGEQSVEVNLKTAPPSPPLPPLATLPSLPAAVVALPYAQQLAAIGGKAGLTWSAPVPLPDGLTLSSDGKLSGTPAKAGQFIVKAQVSDGTTTIASAYALTIRDALAIDDAASTRAPGFTPQFRLVSAAANSVNATAQCDAKEFVVTGGGTCSVPNNNLLRGVLSSSQPSANGWSVKCGFGAATAIAVCSLR
jgi:hypothetical protein